MYCRLIQLMEQYKKYREDPNVSGKEMDILNSFLESEYKDDYVKKKYDLQYNLIRDFPVSYIVWLIHAFEIKNYPIFHYLLPYFELIKYIYHVWDDYASIAYADHTRVYPHNELYEYIYTIKDFLRRIANMDRETYFRTNMNYSTKSKWVWYAYFPLLKDGKELILKYISFSILHDSQNFLMYGIYQIETEQLYPFFKEFISIIIEQEKHDLPCLELLCGASGTYSDVFNVIKKLHNAGYNIIDDPQFEKLFSEDVKIKMYIDMKKDTVHNEYISYYMPDFI